MGYSKIALEDRILGMYPEIGKHAINVDLNFNEDKKSYIIHFRKDSHELITYLDKSDADECMNDVKCIHLGVKIGEFIKNFNTLS